MIRLLAFLVAAAILPATALLSGEVDEVNQRRLRADVEDLALRNARRAARVLEDQANEQLGALKDAQALTWSPEMLGSLGRPRTGGDVAPSENDGEAARAEQLLRRWRESFDVIGVQSLDGEPTPGAEEAWRGNTSAALNARVRSEGAAWEVTLRASRPTLAYLVRVPIEGGGPPRAFYFEKRLDEHVLHAAVGRVNAAVALADGRGALVSAGPPEEVGRMVTGLGGGGLAGSYADDKGAWAAAAVPVGSAVALWAYAPAAAVAPTGPTLRSLIKPALWSVGGLLSFMVVLVAFAPGRRAAEARPEAEDEAPGPMEADGAEPVAAMPVAASTGPLARVTAPQRTTAGVPRGTDPTLSAAVRRTGPEWTASQRAAAADVVTVSGPMPSARQPTTLGRYLLLERIGEGGMAEVFTALSFGSEGFRRRVVIKRLRPELIHDPVAVSQFVDEAKFASSMTHSNVLPVLDFGRVGEQYFMATEYVLGRDLTQVNERTLERTGRPMPLPLVAYIGCELLKALEYAHERKSDDGRPLNLVHRDVSPGNVLVSAHGEVKLLDFGVAKALVRDTPTTAQGVVKGNFYFMSPEQAKGQPVDHRSDLFSLGLILYYAATGGMLYRGNTPYELLLRAATGLTTRDHAALTALPQPFAGVLARALQTDRDARFASAAEFRRALAEVQPASGDHLRELMGRLFAGEFNAEDNRFSAELIALGDGPYDPLAHPEEVPTEGDGSSAAM